MKNLNNNELMGVNGGSMSFSVAAILAGVGAGITFIIGLIDGMIRPLKCN